MIDSPDFDLFVIGTRCQILSISGESTTCYVPVEDKYILCKLQLAVRISK